MMQNERRSKTNERPEKTRKPYTKPTLNSEPIFETLALACGKRAGQGGLCNSAPRRS
jgi:hypothetical protein